MSEWVEGEWQPVRIAPAENARFHPKAPPEHREIWQVVQGRIIRVRPDNSSTSNRMFRAAGCEASQFFIVHPEDVTGDPSADVVCEHQILAD